MPNHRACTHTRTGLTVVEVLIALVLLAVGLEAALALQASALRATNHAQRIERLAEHVATLAESLAVQPCPVAASARATSDGDLRWGVRHTPHTATVDLVAQPRVGAPWSIEQVIPC